MWIETITSGPFQTNTYLIVDNKKVGAIIDPTFGVKALLLDQIEKHDISICGIYLTHSHIDHIAEVKELKEIFQCLVWIHPLDEDNLIEPGSDGIPLPFAFDGVHPDCYFHEGEIIHCGDLEAQILHTPGHSPGGVCLYFQKENTLFSGDTLFKGSIGNIGFPTAEPDKMFQSLEHLSQLPKDTVVYPGHGEATSIGEEDWLPNARAIFS